MAINLGTLRNIMRNDKGIATDVVRLEQIVWLVFLKIFDNMEENLEFENENYRSIIPDKYKWRNWAVDNKDGKVLTGDELLDFVNQMLKDFINLPVDQFTPIAQRRVRDVFASGINNYSKNGAILREVVNHIEQNVDFDDARNRHAFGEIYEEMLRMLQGAGSAGEFYTPRAITKFIIQQLNPQLGERFADFTSGTGGFLTATLEHIRKNGLNNATDQENYKKAVFGQEWKPLPYLLSIANLILHEVEEPNIINGDSLSLYKDDTKESDLFNVIGMNPPYGGSADSIVIKNFPVDMRSSETADLFVQLIMNRLAPNGRAGVIIPDGFLFGTDGAKKNIKTKLLKDFNVHTIIRLPGSVFAPYTPIATNIIFFDKKKADGASDKYNTNKTWFYRLDMPEGIKHFSKTKPMTLEHCQPIVEWWNNRQEIIVRDENNEVISEKSRCFTAEELIAMSCNFDQCKFPTEQEDILEPAELLADYHKRREALDNKIDTTLTKIQDLLNISFNA